MPDPDGLSTLYLIAAAGGALWALVAAWRAGAVSANEPDRQQGLLLGFSDRMAGLCAAFVFACGFFIFGLLALLPGALWWTPIGLAVLLALAVLLFSLGFVKGRVKNNRAFTAACLLGTPLAAPAKLVFKAAGLSAASDVTEEDVLSFVDDVEEHDLIDESQKKMITNIFELDEVTAGDIMTHRTEIMSVEENTPVSDAVRISLENGFSRLPVYRKTLDDVVGILYVKDLFSIWDAPQRAGEPVKDFMRSVMFVPESCKARELLVDFKVKHTQIAVVVDEYGGTSGIATMEDVLEEIVGNIQDEFDNEDADMVAVEDGYVAAGSADLEEVFEAFGLEPPDEDEDGEADFDTVGGLIIDHLGHIPAADESVEVLYGGLLFTVLEVEDRRVGKVKCQLAPENKPEEDQEEEEDA